MLICQNAEGVHGQRKVVNSGLKEAAHRWMKGPTI